jgi:GT2 family glycosyltransferase
VVDNASGDGSDIVIEELIGAQQWRDWVRLERSPVNGGFSAGNNFGILRIEAEYYLLLNSDTIVRPGAIAHLLAAARSHPSAGLIGPRLEWPDARPQESCFRNRGPLKEFLTAARTDFVDRLFTPWIHKYTIRDQPFQAEWTSFACVLVRREVFERVGLLDEGYFMYFEDMDFCRRAWKAGYGVLHYPRARVVHLRGGSGDVKQLTAKRKRPPRYWYASRNRYYGKFFGRLGFWFANLCWYAGRSISLTREILGQKTPHTNKLQWLDIWTNGLRPLHPPQRPTPRGKS